MKDLEKVQKTLSDVFDYLNGNNLQLVGKELLTEVGDAHRIVENLAIHDVMCSAEWDTDLENIGLPSNMHFSFGSEFGDIVYRLQKTKNVRWCVFSVDRNYYVIEQQSVNGEWVENWTKQMNKSRDEAKAYAENELTKHYT